MITSVAQCRDWPIIRIGFVSLPRDFGIEKEVIIIICDGITRLAIESFGDQTEGFVFTEHTEAAKSEWHSWVSLPLKSEQVDVEHKWNCHGGSFFLSRPFPPFDWANKNPSHYVGFSLLFCFFSNVDRPFNFAPLDEP